jgi:hypothetical protein
MLRFVVPSGIGDISWIYSKICNLAKTRKIGIEICDDKPRRSAPFVERLPSVHCLGYAVGVSYSNIMSEALPTDTDLSKLADGQYVINLNRHLESGKHLKDAFPAQDTEYHYRIPDPPAEARLNRFKGHDRLKIGFYCSSVNHRPELSFWTPEQWVQFLEMVRAAYPSALFVGIGAPYDDKTREVCDLLGERGFPLMRWLSQDIAVTIAVIRGLDFFFSFPSGLGILADVVNTPCQMWFWSNVPGWESHAGLPGKYADPEHVKSGFHYTAPYEDPGTSFARFVERGANFIPMRINYIA